MGGAGIAAQPGGCQVCPQQLFGLKADDPLTYTGALVVVMLSTWLPARRAAAINPVHALRYE
jgi:hypothetical protein